jgi:group II intron reverse transcriptase/maturase
MKERMQKIPTLSGSCPQKNRTESESYAGVQTFIGITENNLVEVQFTKDDLLERILSAANMNRAYKQVVSNSGSGGVDKMETEGLLAYLKIHKDELIASLLDGSYRPNPVLRVEIPKDNGKKRQLGIPTVVDRLVQQSISQVLSPLYEREFSDNSFGFRPKRSAHKALVRAQSYVSAGYKYCVDLDLEKFFDTVNHNKLIEVLSRVVRDGRVISLIHKYLQSGVMVNHQYEDSTQGVPQGGPLSPLLSNIMLNELDNELEGRGHKFVRYADDCMIFCRSKRSAHRVKESITRFIEHTLYLRVNREKTTVGNLIGMKFLGYSFYLQKGECRLCVHPKSYQKLKTRLKELTGRSNGMGYARRKHKLHLLLRGWVEYFKLADMQSRLQRIDEWLRRRLRMCIWKSWKNGQTRIRNLIRCGIDKWKAGQWGYVKGYWRVAGSPILQRSVTTDNLRKSGYPCLMDYYGKLHRK